MQANRRGPIHDLWKLLHRISANFEDFPAAWVNTAACTSPLSTGGNSDATVYGNTPQNCIIGPPQKNVDLTLEKVFKIEGRQDLRFRADSFNLLNHLSFANPLQRWLLGRGQDCRRSVLCGSLRRSERRG
jgi:hypothetical protein